MLKQKARGLWPYLLVLAAADYLLPLLMKDTGGAMVVLLCVIPVITLICGVVYGVRQGFDGLLPLVAMVLFAPAVALYMNFTAWLYIPAYGLAALAGNGIGRLFYGKR